MPPARGACLAGPLGLARALHPGPLQRPPRAPIPGRSGRLSDPGRRRRLPRALRGALRPADRAPRAGDLADASRRGVRGRRGRKGVRGRAGRRGDRPVRRAVRPAGYGGLAPDVVQMHSVAYRNPGTLPSGRILVVGGNTGFQIAEEPASVREVLLSIGSRQAPPPAALPGARPLLVADAAATDGEVGRDPHRAADEEPRAGARRLVAAQAPPAPRGAHLAARGLRRLPHRRLRRRAPSRSRR